MRERIYRLSVVILFTYLLAGSSKPVFEQKTNKFWKYNHASNTWVQLPLPHDILSCHNHICSTVATIRHVEEINEIRDGTFTSEATKDEKPAEIELPVRKRTSLTTMSETSIFITGESGSIYRRYWNGVQWIVSPHHLPVTSGPAVAVFIVNSTIFALSETGKLHQVLLHKSEPSWEDVTPIFLKSQALLKSGVVSRDGRTAFFAAKKGFLIELLQINPTRWENHGAPHGGDVAVIADSSSVRQDVVYAISSAGDLYEYDKSSKPSWKKHLGVENGELMATTGCVVNGGPISFSLFLLTKKGGIVERRFDQRKWKWVRHDSPKHHNMSSITPAPQDSGESFHSMFLTSSSGTVFEYRIQKQPVWVNHGHPNHARIARGKTGVQVESGKMMFLLDDGRTAELHQIKMRKNAPLTYRWSVHEAPESEGWNAEYCKDERGPMNCVNGVKDESFDSPSVKWKRKGQTQETYLVPEVGEKNDTLNRYSLPRGVNNDFRLRAYPGVGLLTLISRDGSLYEFLDVQNVLLWVKHDQPLSIGVLGSYNGTVFVADGDGNLLSRDRMSEKQEWFNVSTKWTRVVAGAPWDGNPSRRFKDIAEDALFFVSRDGRLLQLNVAYNNFKWKDCGSPGRSRVAAIVDQEQLREHILFVVGRDGKLYQFNRLTRLWHEHYQSAHLKLSRSPGTTIRDSLGSLTGSLFMLSEEWGLIQYIWRGDGWEWVEHGSPNTDVTIISPPSPCFHGKYLFLIGSDGNVYMRFKDRHMNWEWKNCGFPVELSVFEDACFAREDKMAYNQCDPMVASTRAAPLSDSSVVFELRDGRVAELKQKDDAEWKWTRIITTPTTSCFTKPLSTI